MPLIKCPECGKEIADTIESCIHCGFVLPKNEERINDDVVLKYDNADEKTAEHSNQTKKSPPKRVIRKRF